MNQGTQGYAIIENGQYNTASEGGKGVSGGPYLVRIEGFDGNKDPDNELPFGRPYFTDFEQTVDLPNADSEQYFEVPAKER